MNVMQTMLSELCADVVFSLSLEHVFINFTIVCGKDEKSFLSVCFRPTPEHGGLSFARNSVLCELCHFNVLDDGRIS
jgi:hypothetical protein